ncbi:hypothetical protein ASZ78_002060 [Callipepla squamata]|uniref:Cilia- and flagella-associated protein 251 n=1 Tax=Callipepla squamata TaxID=9009 RepID=A0A226NA39_CALSU|nr:hypothetical protein ASZ78_002060 [Callipepla squamata]
MARGTAKRVTPDLGAARTPTSVPSQGLHGCCSGRWSSGRCCSNHTSEGSWRAGAVRQHSQPGVGGTAWPALPGREAELPPSCKYQWAGEQPWDTKLCPVTSGDFGGSLFPTAKSLFFLQSLSWALGYNSSLAVHSMEDGVLLYVCSHTAVIHDVLGSRQYHLQVCGPLSSLSAFLPPLGLVGWPWGRFGAAQSRSGERKMEDSRVGRWEIPPAKQLWSCQVFLSSFPGPCECYLMPVCQRGQALGGHCRQRSGPIGHCVGRLLRVRLHADLPYPAWGQHRLLCTPYPQTLSCPHNLPRVPMRIFPRRIPVRTIFDSHAGSGICAIAISQDAKFLVTISAGTVQRVCVWRWTCPDESPVCDVELSPEFGFQEFVIFNPQNHSEFVSNSKTQVIFYLWGDAGLQYSTPPLTKETFGSTVGHFTQSAFHPNTAQALTGTSAGKVVVWDVERKWGPTEGQQGRLRGMTATKLVPVQEESLTVLMVMESCIVTGDVRGQVKFYDGHLQLLACYDLSDMGSVRSISFSKAPPDPPSASSTSRQPITARNFILSTSDATVLHVATDGTDFEKVMEEAKKAVMAIACHPQQAWLAVGSHCGLLKVWDYQQPQLLTSRMFPRAGVQCLSYDPAGSFLAAGFTDGSVHVLDAISLLSCCEVFRFSRGPVTHIHFSHDSKYLATADEKYAVTVYKRVLQNECRRWEHLAGLHSHYKPIRSILFGVQLDGSEPRLLSLGEDRQLIEYDLSSSSKDQLVVLHRHRVEQAAVPLCLAWYPQFSTESFILTANSCYKMKLYNATTKMCRKTFLGPTYGSPLEKIQILPASAAQPQKHYLAYITKDKVGLQILPIDGNPHKSSAFICHPDGASDLAISYDGHYIFTAGGNDCTVLKWEVNLNALEAAASLGGEDLVPFYSLLEGGQDGELFRIAFNGGLIDVTVSKS